MKAIKKYQFIQIAKLSVLLTLSVAIFVLTANAANRTWDGGGATNNWSEAANWSDDTVPGASDKAIFDATSTKDCTIDVVVTVNQFEINSGYTGTITQGSFSFTVSDTYVQSGGTFTGGSAFLDFKAPFTLSGGTFNASTTDIAFFASNFTVGSGGTFNHNNGRVQFYSNFGIIDVDSSLQFNDLDINKSPTGFVTIANNDTLIVNGRLDLKQGGLDGTGNRKIQANGDFSVSTNFSGGTGNVELAGNATRIVTFEAGSTIPNLTVNAPNVDIDTSGSGTVTFDGFLDIQDVNSFSNGAVEFIVEGAYTQSGGTFTQGSGVFDVESTYTQTGGTFNGGSANFWCRQNFSLNGGTFTSTTALALFGFSFTVASGATFNHNNGSVQFFGVSGIYDVDSSLDFFNVRYSKNTNSDISIAANDTLVVNGTLFLNTGSLNGGIGAKIEVRGDLVINPDFMTGNSQSVEISFEGNAVQTLTDNGGEKPRGIWTLNKPGGTVNLATNFDLTNTLNVFNFTNGTITTGNFTFNLGNKNVVSGGGYVIGNLQRSYTSTGSKNFDVGTANGYSPVGVEVTSLNTNPSSMTIAAIEGVHPNSPNPGGSLERYWDLTETGDLAAILTFNYLDTDVPGTVSESDLVLRRYTGTGMLFDIIPATIDDTANTITTDNSITNFSDWTAFRLAPTAAAVDVGGRVLTEKGRGISRAVLSITDQSGNTRTTITNPFGYYRFIGIQVGQLYTISVAHKSYQFAEPTRVIMINEAISNLDFIAQNIVSTKGSASIEGRVLDKQGKGIGGVKLEISGGSLSKPVYAVTDKQGKFIFKDLQVGDTYILTPQSKAFVFEEPTKIIYLEDFMTDIDFKLIN